MEPSPNRYAEFLVEYGSNLCRGEALYCQGYNWSHSGAGAIRLLGFVARGLCGSGSVEANAGDSPQLGAESVGQRFLA
jgi:hypothetical protein